MITAASTKRQWVKPTLYELYLTGSTQLWQGSFCKQGQGNIYLQHTIWGQIDGNFLLLIHIIELLSRLPTMAMPPWASYEIRRFAGCACAGNAGIVFPNNDFKKKRKLAIPTCARAVMHIGIANPSGGENVPGACATRNLTYPVRGPWRYQYWVRGMDK